MTDFSSLAKIRLIVKIDMLIYDRSKLRHKRGTPEFYRQEGELNMLEQVKKLIEED